MIDKNKKYTLVDGTEVKIYEVYESELLTNVVHGAYKTTSGWQLASWGEGGQAMRGVASTNDLIEVSPYADFQIDDKVLVWEDDTRQYKSYFAGTGRTGKAEVWADGRTSYNETRRIGWKHCIKYVEPTA
jgi:hypothetical protein